jgi:hypothetical protein
LACWRGWFFGFGLFFGLCWDGTSMETMLDGLVWDKMKDAFLAIFTGGVPKWLL